MKKSDAIYIISKIEEQFPDAKCELDYTSLYELTIAVILSAQTTDQAVNIVTKGLFNAFPDILTLSKANIEDVQQYIKRIGLFRNKSKNIILLAKKVIEDYQGVIPNTFEQLTSLPGVGRKSANVILSEYFKIPAIAVDTHVERTSKRLGFAKQEDNVLTVEKKLQKVLPKESWSKAHQLLVLFGRYHCKAIKPNCKECSLYDLCKYKEKSK